MFFLPESDEFGDLVCSKLRESLDQVHCIAPI
jgi:hypothetical protein